MPVDNPIQFALVREDADTEFAVLDALQKDARSALLVASGGCTALSLMARRPDLALTLIDANQHQLDLVGRKLTALRDHPPGSPARRTLFGVDVDDDASLSGCGNFESLFRGLRAVLDDLVMPAGERRALLSSGAGPERTARLTSLLGNCYWPVAFELFFSDALLEAMFGTDATQHAPRGSYPGYFRGVVERGLQRDDAARNWFLHQVLLGHGLEGALPDWFGASFGGLTQPTMLHAGMADAPSFSTFDVIQLSNLFDWMNSDDVNAIVARLCAECRPGTVVLLRQLNNRAPVEQAMAPAFDVDFALSGRLTRDDRSLFYERILVFVRRSETP
jgi:S-adenosylmethionine-diacylglycerol 3-amino-3-carboxypropyl transferase